MKDRFMNLANPQNGDRDARLEKVLAEYLLALEAGNSVDPQQLLNQHADLADDLRSFLANRAALERIASPLKLAVDETTVGCVTRDHDGEVQRIRYFGDYELIDELGRGGMGVVYKARQTTLNRTVAIKMILGGQLASPEDIQRFKQEAEAAANLDHPQITPIYETGEHNGQHYFSMKFIEGRTLRDTLPELRQEGKSPRQAVLLLSQVARAVHHAHQRGVLHRDLKPANVLLDLNGVPYITDFGLAKRVEGASDVTKTGAIVGTPSYMAPEQANGRKQLSTAVDIYSLGAILYEILTGQPPFRGTTPLETLLQVAAGEIVAPRSIARNSDRDLETIALKCLEMEPENRYDSAAALADDLDRWLNQEPIQARRSGYIERMVKWSRRHPAVAALLMVIVMLVLAGQVLIGWQLRQTALALIRGEGLRLVAQSEVVRSADPGLALGMAIEAAHLHPGLAANNSLLEAMNECREFKTLIGHKEPVTYSEISSDGSRVLSQSTEQKIRLWNAKTGQQVAVLWNGTDQSAGSSSDGRPGSVEDYLQQSMLVAHFSPDGHRIVTVTSLFSIWIWDAATGKFLRELQGPVRDHEKSYLAYGEAGGACAQFHPQGRLLAVSFGDYGHPDYRVRLWDVESGSEVAALDGHHAPVQHLQFSPNGNILASASRDGTVRLWNSEKGTELLKLEGHRVGVGFACFSPDGKRIITTGDGNEWEYPAPNEGRISYNSNSDHQDRFAGIVWDVVTGKQLSSLDWPEGSYAVVNPAAFSQDGRLILTFPSASYSGDSSIIGHPVIWDTSTGKRRFVLRHSGSNGKYLSGRFEGDSETVAMVQRVDRFIKSKSLQVYRWSTTTGQQLGSVVSLNGHTGEVRAASFSIDGAFVVTSADDSTSRVWDVTANGDKTVGQGRFQNLSSARFTAEGDKLFSIAKRKRGSPPLLQIQDVGSRKIVRSFPLYSTDDELQILAISPDDRMVITGEGRGGTNNVDFAGNIRIWDATTGRQVSQFGKPQEDFVSVKFSPDGRRVFAGGNRSAASYLWETAEDKPVREVFRLSDFPVWSAEFSPDGTRLLTTGRQPGRVFFESGKEMEIARIWDTSNGRLVKVLTDMSGQVRSDLSLTWSPNGRQVLVPCAGGNNARIWDIKSNVVIVDFQGHTKGVTCGHFTADGKKVATGSSDKSLRIWDIASGRELKRLQGHEDAVRTLNFSPNGQLLVSTGSDHTMRIWNVQTGTEVATARFDNLLFDSAVFSRDGQNILTTASSEARNWPIDFLKVAESRRPRDFTPEEQEKFEITR